MLIRAVRLPLTALAAILLVPSSLPAQRNPSLKLIASIGSPTGVTAVYTRGGVQVAWQGVSGAAQYQVYRGPDEQSMGQLVALPYNVLSYLDQGFNAPAVYRIVAVSPRGATGASDLVSYSPPVALSSTLLSGTRTAYMGTLLTSPITTLPPVVTALEQPPLGVASIRNGQSMVVTGTGLDGITGVALVETWYYGGGFQSGTRKFEPPGWYVYPNATAYPFTPTNVTQTSFTIVPQVPTPYNLLQSTSYKVIVTKSTGIDTSDVKIDIFGALPVRKITGVAKTVIRSGGRVDVTGVGLDQTSAGYFGTGLQGSVTNPMFNIWNRSATALQLATTAACDQEGFIELVQVPLATGDPASIYANPAITVACVPQTPSGSLVGGPLSGYLSVLPGSKISISGKYLKYVTRVLTNAGVSLPFTYSKSVNSDILTVTLPSPTQPISMSFSLENVLTDPVVAGTVTGGVTFMFPATFNGISPAWAEPGRLVRVTGHNIQYGNPIQVTVGGVPAQVVSADALTTTFRLGAGTTTGPIEIQNEAGKTALTGPFATYPTQHPGFFVVSGPSVVTQIEVPPGLAFGSVITVRGQNLARLAGICLPSAGIGGVPPGPLVLKRVETDYTTIASNTVMQVAFNWQPNFAAPGPIQILAPTVPPGDFVNVSNFACAANGAAVNWQ